MLAAASSASISAGDQARSFRVSSNPTKPHQCSWTKIGTTAMERIPWGSRYARSSEGNVRTAPAIALPAASSRCHRGIAL
ncbi:hypothetical protein DSECCO2_561780 [anaerobic digester metagenome]